MGIILAKRFTLFALLWLALTHGDPSGWIVGAITAAGTTWSSLALLPPSGRRVDLLAVLRLIPGFLLRSFHGGIDVARRALHPRMPLDYGWIVYRTKLSAGLPRVSFGSETSLLPGSLVAGARGDQVFVHCLDRGQDIEGNLRREEERIAATLHEGGLERERA